MTTIPSRGARPEKDKINLGALAEHIDNQRRILSGTEFHSRSQARLADDTRKQQRLEDELADARDRVKETTDMISRLQGLLILQEAREADIAVELAATNESIGSLKASGIYLPKEETQTAQAAQ